MNAEAILPGKTVKYPFLSAAGALTNSKQGKPCQNCDEKLACIMAFFKLFVMQDG